MNESLKDFLVSLAILSVVVVASIVFGSLTVPNANRVIEKGFKVYDKDGYPVEKFDSNYNYWTLVPKP